jgi:pSer/pThr/pTyr-binding forkhead associated (FHA) protein
MAIKLVVRNKERNSSSDEKTLTFNEMLVTIGSNQSATVFLADAKIAPEQVVIINEDEDQLLINQGKGTILNGHEIVEGLRYKLKNNDEVSMGSYSLTVLLLNNNNKESENYAEEQSSNLNLPSDTDLSGTEYNKLDARSFADILTSLRKEEDQYYFQITDNDGAKRRLPIEDDDLVLGWSQETKIFTSEKQANIEKPEAVIRKDWSGVTLYPRGNEAILVNDVLLEASTRLKNGDKIVFTRRLNDVSQMATLVFCEPAALHELNTILPQELLSNAFETLQSGQIKADPEEIKENKIVNEKPPYVKSARKNTEKKNKHYFGYFTTIEIVIMLFATIITAFLTFVLLEFLS